MRVDLDHRLEGVLLLLCEVFFVSLGKDEHGLMPDHWKVPALLHERVEVLYQAIDHPVGEGVLLCQKDLHKDVNSSIVLHLSHLVEGCTGLKDRYGHFGDHTGND